MDEVDGPVGGLNGLLPREGEADETDAERGPVGIPLVLWLGPEGGMVGDVVEAPGWGCWLWLWLRGWVGMDTQPPRPPRPG